MERNTTNAHPLAKAIAALGWSQGTLAERSGVAQSTISFAIRGQRGGKFSAESARKIVETIDRETQRQKLASIRKGDGIPARLTPARALRLEHLIFPYAPESKRKPAAA